MINHILFLTRFTRKCAGSRLRTYQYIDYFQSERYDFHFKEKSLLNDQYLENLFSKKNKPWFSVIRTYLSRLFFLLVSQRQYDLIWIETEIFPYCPAWIELLLLKNKKFVLNYDDAVFHIYDNHKNYLIRLILGKKIDRLMGNANLIIAGNEYLKQRAVSACAKNIQIIPTVVDLDRYYITDRNYMNDHDSVPIIGWIGTAITQKFLKIIETALAEVFCIKKFKLIIIGVNENFKLSGFDYEILPWSENTEIEYLNQIDIGVMPLLDQPFERGKCGYKLIQYMALAKPVIASPVGVNLEIVQHEKNGFLASSSKEWVDAILFLLNNPEKRKSMGAESRKIVEANFSLKKYAPILFQLLDKECNNTI